MKKIAVTGASGFLGANLTEWLMNTYEVIRIARKDREDFISCRIDNTLSSGDCAWLGDAQVVIHCAARAHVMRETSEDPLAEYRNVNTSGSIKLAQYAAAHGIKRFIYISSIKVHGERNHADSAIVEDAQLEPVDPYGISKLEAEQGLLKVAQDTGMEVVIIRPPLIYGPGVKANFETMMKWLNKNRPLPLGAVKNRRSLVGIDNLCSLIETCIEHPNAANQAFLVSDQDDVSITELLAKLKSSLASSSALIPVPISLMKLGATMGGKGTVAQRLFDDLYVSSEKATQLLGWNPPYSMQEQLDKTADYFKTNQKN